MKWKVNAVPSKLERTMKGCGTAMKITSDDVCQPGDDKKGN